MPTVYNGWVGICYPSRIALDSKIDISYPEYFRQVTSGWCTSVLHAKYANFTVGNPGVSVPDNAQWVDHLPDTGVLSNRVTSWGFDVRRNDSFVDYFSYRDERFRNKGVPVHIITMWQYVYTRSGHGWRITLAKRSDFKPDASTLFNGLPSRTLFDYGVVVNVGANRPVRQIINFDPSSVPQPNVGYVFAEPSVADGGHWHYPDLVYRTMQSLTVSAWEQLAHLNENSLQNMLGAASFLVDVLTGRIADAAGTFSKWLEGLSNLARHKRWGEYFSRLLKLSREYGPDVWLKYRYVYSTGAADYDQAAEWLQRQAAVYSSWLRFDANDTLEVPECTCLWHLGFKSRLRDDDILTMLSSRAWLQGMEINPYVIWDFIPFSFVIDWITGTGDRLQLENDQKHWFADFWTREIVWSLKYFRKTKFGTIECYYRFYGPFPALEGFTQHYSASLSVNLKRVGDLTSLVIGGG